MSEAPPPLPQIVGFPPFNQLPQFVFNEAGMAVTESEISAFLSFGPKQILHLIMPPVVAKTFAQQLLSAVTEYEAKMGTEVLTGAEVAARRKEAND